MGELPSENIYDILSRLPVKSLARFRCVSKQWCNYIGDPYLEIMRTQYGGEIKAPMLVMFHQFPHKPPSAVIISLLEFKENAAGAVINLRKNPATMDFTFRESKSKPVVVLGSCKGLLFSSQAYKGGGTKLVVTHPLRKESYQLPPIKLPPCDHRSRQTTYGLGFDDSSNIFKMVCSVSPYYVYGDEVKEEEICTMVHVLGSDSWRAIPQVPSLPIYGQGVFAHGFLHWLTNVNIYWEPNQHIKFIIRFDVRKEEFGLINLPEQITNLSGRDYLVDLAGQVGFVNNNDNKVNVWVLKRIGWVKHCSLDQNPHPRIHSIRDGYLKVLGFWNKDGDVLITNYYWRGLLAVYNLKTGVLREIIFSRSLSRECGNVINMQMYQSSMFSILYSIKNFMK